MSGLFFLLPGLLLPWLGRVLYRRRGLFDRWLVGLTHVVTIAGWVGWAAWSALPAAPDEVERAGRFALITLIGLFYSEVVLLFPRRRHALETAPSTEETDVVAEALPGDTEARAPEPLTTEARELSERIVETASRQVDEVMVSREAVVALAGNETIATALAAMRRSGHSRLLVIEGSLDRILGVAHAKDLVPLQLEGREARRSVSTSDAGCASRPATPSRRCSRTFAAIACTSAWSAIPSAAPLGW
ncbi:MAG: hypothetical protein U0527_12975 [Candidatus Eisenbacteria bacterium]